MTSEPTPTETSIIHTAAIDVAPRLVHEDPEVSKTLMCNTLVGLLLLLTFGANGTVSLRQALHAVFSSGYGGDFRDCFRSLEASVNA